MIAERKDDLFVVPGLGYHWGILENGRGRAASRPTCWPRPSTRRSGSSAAWRWTSCARRASASSPAATTASSGARTASTPRTSSSSSPTWASRRWRRSSPRRSTAPSCCASSTRRGTIEEGKYADLLVVDGDPLEDIAILQDRSKLALVMKDGKVMVNTLGLAAGAHRDPRLHRWTSSTSSARRPRCRPCRRPPRCSIDRRPAPINAATVRGTGIAGPANRI